MAGTYGQIEAKRHFNMVNGVRADKIIKQCTEKKDGDPVHRKRFDSPVDKQGQKNRFAAFAGLDDLIEVDFNHNGIHHKKQAAGDGNRHHRRALDIDSHTVEVLRHARCDFAEQDTGNDTQQHPKLEIAFKNTGHFAVII